MPFRVKLLIGLVLLGAVAASLGIAQWTGQHWWRFGVYLVAVLLSSGMKVILPDSESTMSVNFPFILLAIMQLSPGQALALAAISVFAQCNFHVQKMFSLVQIAFNIANVVNATAVAWLAYTALVQIHLSSAPALSIAAALYFLSNTVPVSLVIAWTKKENVLSFWSDNFRWYLPFYLVGAALSALANFLSFHYGWGTSLLVAPAAYTIYRSYNGQAARQRDQKQHIADMEALHLRTIEGLAMAIEAKDNDTHDHLLRVRVYVSKIGEALALSPPEMQAVLTAALLHDIGKLAVPEYIINKPGKLTPEEFEKMKIHPVVGADILERVRFPYPVVPIVRAHHEWWNGMGYPDGLVGEAIPIGARILTVVDCFDAMASDRPYRRAMPLAQAMEVIGKLAGTQFDPRVVRVLEQRYVEIEELARKEGAKLKKLDTNVSVERGLAPGAGFAQENTGPHSPPQPISPGRQNGASIMLGSAEPELRALHQLSQSPDCTLGSDELAALLALRLQPFIPFNCWVLYLKHGDAVLPQSLQGLAALFFTEAAIPMGDGISGWVAQSGRPIVNGNASVEPNYRCVQSEFQQGLHSALSLPLRDGEGAIFGVLSFYSIAEAAFSTGHLDILQAAEAMFSPVLARAAHSRNKGNVPLPRGVAEARPQPAAAPALVATL